MADKPKKIIRKLVMPDDSEKGREEVYEYEAEEQTLPEQDIAAEETVPRPTRKVTRKMRMPAAAKRGGYEVPEETTTEVEEIDPETLGHARDPKTGKPYETAPEGAESANWFGPVDELIDPTEKLIGLGGKSAPFLLGMLRRPKGKVINPKNVPLESMVRTPLAVLNKEFAKKAMSPDEEKMRRAYTDYLENIGYPKEEREEWIKEAIKARPPVESKSLGENVAYVDPITGTEAGEVMSSRAYLKNLPGQRSPGSVILHEGTHNILSPKGTVEALNRTAYEHILNKKVPDNVKQGIQSLLQGYGYKRHQAESELIPWLGNVINKQITLDNIPDVRTLTREEYTQLKREAREISEYKKLITKNWVGDKEKQWNEFMKDAKKAYNAVLNRAEKLTPEEVAETEKSLIEATRTSTKKRAPRPKTAAMKELTPDVDEEIGVTLEKMRRVNPELGKEPSTLRKFIDKTTDQYREWVDSLPHNRRKLQKHLDWRQRTIEEAELEQKRLEMDELLRQERIREAGGKAPSATKPPTEVE
jgi:hypothetical protein